MDGSFVWSEFEWFWTLLTHFYKKEIFSYVRKDERDYCGALGVEEDEITLDTSFKEDLGADSLDLFELTMALEEEYDTEIPAEELADIETVGDVIEYLREKGIDE